MSISNWMQVGPLAILINMNPINYSDVFWYHATQFDVDSIIEMLCQILPLANLALPEKYPETLENIKNRIQKMSEPDNDFNVIETALIVIRWLVNNKILALNTLNLQYDNSSLNLMVLRIWSDYVAYGDLSIIPILENTNSKQSMKIYARMFVNAVKNPSFNINTIEIPHWLVYSIKSEANGKSDNDHPSILTLTVEEIEAFTEVANMLPTWFYVHALRARIKNTDYQLRIISLIEKIPIRIFEAYFDDFVDFVIWCLRFQNLINPLEELLLNLSCFYYKKVNILISRICETFDYFNETNISSRLNILSVLGRFGDITLLQTVFDTVWEIIPTMQLSISFVLSLIKFCDSFAGDCDDIYDKVIAIALAPLIVYLNSQDYEFLEDSIQLQTLISSIRTFYSVISSDIIVCPSYSIKDSFPLTAISMQLLCGMHIRLSVMNYIIYNIHSLHVAAPEQIIGFIFKCAQNLLPLQIQTCLNIISQHTNCGLGSIGYIIISTFLSKFPAFASLKANFIGPISELPKDSNVTRIIMKLNPATKPLLTMKPSLLFLMLERWSGKPDDIIIGAIRNCIINSKDSEEIRLYRSFLYALDAKQPPEKSNSCHFAADFTANEIIAKNFFNEIMKSKSASEAITVFGQHYPLPVIYDDNEVDLVASLVKMYKRVPVCHSSLIQLVKLLGDKISSSISNSKPLLRFTRSMGINRVINEPRDEFCKQLAVRLGHVKLQNSQNHDENEDEKFIVDMLIANGTKSDEIYKKYNSVILATKFLEHGTNLELLKLSLSTNIASVKVKALNMLPSMEISEISDVCSSSLAEDAINSLDLAIPTAAGAFYCILQIYDNGYSFLAKCVSAIILNITRNCTFSSAMLSLLFVKCSNLIEKIESSKAKKAMLKLIENYKLEEQSLL
ncbi:hypothetical protein TVAG_252720 [Trichomonas vaginalis G3]|uniref:Uncharacterized protein n=1 Tax=Trichomonas vaginalis (strain ATCC PRA-98 / G3) TaxID=412133 RepID=A2DW14_TRIV3|nr:hypothetical protein TVAGG3_0845230 [Trichomonas vaginalis G3]EAY15459.1 hypothetical protein TVAG_252720 [Trichomonas vaginalis G3]KAI5499556.1 hypothetical protein TVAGG3_0845230 [Trichomonas vaginalis G3]|eukprot:XP_001327682.1 hypothetical protein [Trichomonas vaginalis G3]